MIMRTLTTQLSGAVYEGKLPSADGVEAFLFNRNGTGLVVLWNRGNDSAQKKLALNLGAHSCLHRLVGQRHPHHPIRRL